MILLRWIELVHNINNIPILNILPELLPRLLTNLTPKSNQPTKGVEFSKFDLILITNIGLQRDVSRKS